MMTIMLSYGSELLVVTKH